MTTTQNVPFGRTPLYRLSLLALWTNVALAVGCFAVQAICDGVAILSTELFPLALLVILIGAPLFTVWLDRKSRTPRTSEIMCSTLSAAAAFFIALYAGAGWPDHWLAPPLVFSALLIGAPALSIRVHIHEESERQAEQLVLAVEQLTSQLARQHRPRRSRLASNFGILVNRNGRGTGGTARD
ncbi:hypothetical protein [Humibacter ginsenosidimutans]|uniref:Uncharacterized protein n=1 Tax=Humibacter ginsenosidimutans TaxID=2599293 RepID=A0A5B8M369_9MICO|nr:hypothetical protein [Humibacter ginsenosidimutans]QDZ14172.1 hypothetical protein FPZ11_04735 [Humibacter ginsenosidimutans]